MSAARSETLLSLASEDHTVKAAPRKPSSPDSPPELASHIEARERRALERCRAGDISGLAVLYERYSQQVFRICIRILGDRAVAEEQTQEVFIRLFERIDRYRGKAKLSTWLYRLAVNHALNAQRRHRRVKRWEVAGEVSELVAATDVGSPAQRVMRREAADRVQDALSHLSVDQRTIVVLREIEGLSYREIAEVIGTPMGTVMSRLSRARRELQRHCRLEGGIQGASEVSKPIEEESKA